MLPTCSICGGDCFADRAILWPELVAEWCLSSEEAAYIDRQQGRHCTACGANLRVMALGRAVLTALGRDGGTVRGLAGEPDLERLRVLDINGAEGISDAVSALPRYVRGNYPEVDLHALPYGDDRFDLILHSDTLEHVPRPVRALEECRRVLAPGGRLCFTVPVVVGRLSRSREGMPPATTVPRGRRCTTTAWRPSSAPMPGPTCCGQGSSG